MKNLKISIADFAIPVKKTGSLTRDGFFMGMELGANIHKVIQEKNSLTPTYKKEVPLQYKFLTERYCVLVNGRADGVYYGGTPVVEEIKSTFSLETLRREIESNLLHPYRLQALTYAYILQKLENKPAKASLLLVSLKNKKELKVPLEIDSVYEKWLGERLIQLEQKERFRQSQKRKRRGIAQTIKFPFSTPRKHQDDLFNQVEIAVKNGHLALLQAPTGIGKTMGVLLPTLKNSLSRGCQTIYLAPKNRQFEVARDAVLRIDPKSRAIKTRILTAKKKLCQKERLDCNPDYCEFSRDYHDKVNAHRIPSILQRYSVIGKNELLDIAKNFTVCPYQLQMETLDDADLIVGDYAYVFSPHAGLADRFDDLIKGEKLNLIIDEAHNLYQRGIEYYSPTLDVFALISLSKYPIPAKFGKRFKKLIFAALELIKSFKPLNMRSALVNLKWEAFDEIQIKLHQLLIDYLIIGEEILDDDPILDFYLQWSEFSEILKNTGEESLASYIFEEQKEFLKITCCDPSRFLKAIYENFHSVIAFSATLKPFDFYKTMSGFPEHTLTHEYATAFPDENRKVLIIPQISTSYKLREHYYQSISEVVERISILNKGNYLVFFPSYGFLQNTKSFFDNSQFEILIQAKDMKNEDLQEIETRLMDDSKPTIVLAVQGGALSEGIDLNTPNLKGVFIVGPAVPALSYERNLLKGYYDKKHGAGFSFAYIYPAMTRSIQAAGRVIRSDSKRGLIVMMDSRFVKEEYVETMPRYWYKSSVTELVSRKILSDINEFWGEKSLSLNLAKKTN